MEKYIEPCKHLHWSITEMKIFLEVYSETASQLDIVRTYELLFMMIIIKVNIVFFLNRQQGLRSVWKRYMDGITGCLLAMYHN